MILIVSSNMGFKKFYFNIFFLLSVRLFILFPAILVLYMEIKLILKRYDGAIKPSHYIGRKELAICLDKSICGNINKTKVMKKLK